MILSAQTMIIGDGKTVLREGGILVSGGKIAAVGPLSALLETHPDEPHIDYGSATLLPGMIDMHVHLAYYASRRDAAQFTPHLTAYLALNRAQHFLKMGVTTLRDIFGPHDLCRQLSYAGAQKLVRIPRLLYCNQALTVSGGIDWDADGTVEVDGTEEIRKVVRQQVRTGATWVKAMCDARTPGLAEFDQDELDMIVRESHHRGVKAAAHANMQPAVQMCINAGFDTIEHASHLTAEQAKAMADKNLALVSTSYVYQYLYDSMKNQPKSGDDNYSSDKAFQAFKSNAETYRSNFHDIINSGVTIVAGTDCPFDGVEHVTVAWELENMVSCGMNPLAAIAAATSSPARVLGLEGEIGLLAPGLGADIAVADARADTDITALKRVRAVYQAGEEVCLH